MWFESVTAHAFGPFEGQAKKFGPGMNVVHGPNESGKSTWHAAVYAGLCGMRRARGRRKREDQEFADRHRPWDGESWEVGSVVALEDGKRVELRHDLDGQVACSARDSDLADRDYSGDIMNDGAPDGSMWLGLGRDAFLNTACVVQRDLLGVIERETNSSRRPRVDALQEQLQRAAATPVAMRRQPGRWRCSRSIAARTSVRPRPSVATSKRMGVSRCSARTAGWPSANSRSLSTARRSSGSRARRAQRTAKPSGYERPREVG